jgi:hypothetical protein
MASPGWQVLKFVAMMNPFSLPLVFLRRDEVQSCELELPGARRMSEA